MTHIGVTDALQLIIHMYSAVLVMADIQLDYTVQKIVGALLTALWFSMLIFTMFLTFNRLSTILLGKWFPVLTSTNLNYVSYFWKLCL
ncbi:hypothetical protein GCK32_012541 [Trichostrongylus colubriformis]|uniref:Uncharacterized protein n=1 Tax=Trichostrongylus colubriformis TaxID=6319 RepID=A0AAN8EZ85_TRICO